MSADERRSRRASLPERFVEAVVDPDELAQTDSDGMARPPRILVLHSQLDPGTRARPELVSRPLRLCVDLSEIGAEVLCANVETLGAPHHVVRDCEDVEAGVPVELYQLGDAERAVAPGRVRVSSARSGAWLWSSPTCSAAATAVRASRWW